jgi:benzil reductase ((S)-benzoin forming)
MDYFFITGTSKGLGRAVGELLLELGYVVYGLSRSSTIIHKNYTHITIDLNDLKSVESYKFPKIENAERIILINNAGIIGDIKRIGKIDVEQIISTYNVNLIAPTILINSFVYTYKKKKAEKLVLNISSGAGRIPMDGWSVYCSTKSAIDMFSNVLKNEVIKDQNNIEVLSLSPGLVDSEMQEQIRKSSGEDFSNIQKFLDFKKNKDLDSPEDTAKKILRFIDNTKIAAEVICSVKELT